MHRRIRDARRFSFCLLIVLCSIAFFSMPAMAKSKVIIKDYVCYGFGASLKVKIKNSLKQTITVTGAAKCRTEGYEYLGSESDVIDSYDYEREDFDEYFLPCTIKYKARKTVKIKPGKTKWVLYRKTSKGRYLFDDGTDDKITVTYKLRGKKKTISKWFYDTESFD